MSLKIIQEKLNSLHCQSAQEEEHAIREITQEIALAGLSRANFFKAAAFGGGTCLRILHGLDRFSEDLDFILQKSMPDFKLESYLKNLRLEFESYGYQLEVSDRAHTEPTVKKGFVKDDSIGKVLTFQHLKINRSVRKINIRIEVDTNPPEGSGFESKFLDFPFPFAVVAQDLPSLFAGKNHALLCREYTKGRDWYDFIWYTGRKTRINFALLSSAINQQGTWKGQGLKVGLPWYLDHMAKRIRSLDWEMAKRDVARFLKPTQLDTLKFWSADFFLSRLEKLQQAE